jgi:hypothetical protein
MWQPCPIAAKRIVHLIMPRVCLYAHAHQTNAAVAWAVIVVFIPELFMAFFIKEMYYSVYVCRYHPRMQQTLGCFFTFLALTYV